MKKIHVSLVCFTIIYFLEEFFFYAHNKKYN